MLDALISTLKQDYAALPWYKKIFFSGSLLRLINQYSSKTSDIAKLEVAFNIFNAYFNSIWFFQRWFTCLDKFINSAAGKYCQEIHRERLFSLKAFRIGNSYALNFQVYPSIELLGIMNTVDPYNSTNSYDFLVYLAYYGLLKDSVITSNFHIFRNLYNQHRVRNDLGRIIQCFSIIKKMNILEYSYISYILQKADLENYLSILKSLESLGEFNDSDKRNIFYKIENNRNLSWVVRILELYKEQKKLDKAKAIQIIDLDYSGAKLFIIDILEKNKFLLNLNYLDQLLSGLDYALAKSSLEKLQTAGLLTKDNVDLVLLDDGRQKFSLMLILLSDLNLLTQENINQLRSKSVFCIQALLALRANSLLNKDIFYKFVSYQEDTPFLLITLLKDNDLLNATNFAIINDVEDESLFLCCDLLTELCKAKILNQKTFSLLLGTKLVYEVVTVIKFLYEKRLMIEGIDYTALLMHPKKTVILNILVVLQREKLLHQVNLAKLVAIDDGGVIDLGEVYNDYRYGSLLATSQEDFDLLLLGQNAAVVLEFIKSSRFAHASLITADNLRLMLRSVRPMLVCEVFNLLSDIFDEIEQKDFIAICSMDVENLEKIQKEWATDSDENSPLVTTTISEILEPYLPKDSPSAPGRNGLFGGGLGSINPHQAADDLSLGMTPILN